MYFDDNELKFILSCIDRAELNQTAELRYKSMLMIRICDELEQRVNPEVSANELLLDEKKNGAGEPALSKV